MAAGYARTELSGNAPRWLFRCSAGEGCELLGQMGVQYSYGDVVDINNAGEIIGHFYEGLQLPIRTFRYSDAEGFVIINPDSPYDFEPTDINDRGDIVGTMNLGDGVYRAWHWRDGALTELGTLGGQNSNAYYVNNEGVVVGSAVTSNGVRRAFR